MPYFSPDKTRVVVTFKQRDGRIFGRVLADSYEDLKGGKVFLLGMSVAAALGPRDLWISNGLEYSIGRDQLDPECPFEVHTELMATKPARRSGSTVSLRHRFA